MGLLSSLGKIGGAIGKFTPFIGAGITAFEIGKSLTGGGKKKKKGPGNIGADDLLGKQTEIADTSLNFARDLSGRASANLGTAENYLKPLVSGGTQEIAQALSPEIGAISGGYNQAIESAGRFAPRGGGQAFATTMARTQRNAAIANLMSRKRGQAAGQLGQLGLGEAQTAVGSARTAGAAVSSNLDILERRRAGKMGLIGAGLETGGAVLARMIFGGKGDKN